MPVAVASVPGPQSPVCQALLQSLGTMLEHQSSTIGAATSTFPRLERLASTYSNAFIVVCKASPCASTTWENALLKSVIFSAGMVVWVCYMIQGKSGRAGLALLVMAIAMLASGAPT